ncbi:hypothetical protein F9C07_2278553 [Aspergillus flavus]|uniref:Mitochondrial carrier domain-containing protein n=3 Tax=Aspergillus subgen. Circumdati TaxID=2720871 RepID=A0A7U2MNQ8_ASPFN|nr:hypothetical protein Ao3042_03946 [Aspergillus oryzae 3.042]KAB8248658.1 hypothetical protein BDV35DRAFT_390916 [Aspergillus flavus]KAF7627432.1 hypothetical protein AFLA_002813 [Aspergillus flavus NRRL3357]KDE78443.1 hypothetical protein AO1008_04598 [Aspergillus oryzae 100-8]KAJ1708625.1 hypothetical protein NYO67_9188 [Aspergillus flavus]|eukprot:EIT79628.1 hypothetical protein Ao3042_03946 [Aspergillus oryzae 3.042]
MQEGRTVSQPPQMSYTASQTLQGDWGSSVAGRLAGDLTAAAVSASLIAPTVTIIDRALVERAASDRPLLQSLRSYTVAALKRPGAFVFSRPFGLVWTLYGATYAVANGTETITKEICPARVDPITFATTFIVNVPLGVWKDIRFAQLFGTQIQSSAKEALRVSSRIVSKAATATFLLRDGVTIFGSFTLASWCSSVIPDSLASQPSTKTIITQIAVPVLSQVVATPLHLLGLDLYNRQSGVTWSDRIATIRKHLPSATVIRCVRIIPAFGFGCLTNIGLREFFHEQCD